MVADSNVRARIGMLDWGVHTMPACRIYCRMLYSKSSAMCLQNVVRCGHATCREETATHTDALGRPGNCIASAARQRGAPVIAQAHGVKK